MSSLKKFRSSRFGNRASGMGSLEGTCGSVGRAGGREDNCSLRHPRRPLELFLSVVTSGIELRIPGVCARRNAGRFDRVCSLVSFLLPIGVREEGMR